MSELAFFIDYSRCIGCQACMHACAECDTHRGTSLIHLETIERRDSVQTAPQVCMHCEEPSCASVCPVGALYKSKAGPVAYDESKCIGCRYCMAACPFQVPKYEWDKPLPRVQKCIGCLARVEAGKQTACAEACPAGATMFGEREALLHEAHARLRDNPGAYVDQVYGEHEVGGTNNLFLASVPFADLGFPTNLPNSAMPNYTWEVLSKIPNVVSIGATALLGIWWIVNRRMRIERLAVEEAERRREETSQDIEARAANARRTQGGRP